MLSFHVSSSQGCELLLRHQELHPSKHFVDQPLRNCNWNHITKFQVNFTYSQTFSLNPTVLFVPSFSKSAALANRIFHEILNASFYKYSQKNGLRLTTKANKKLVNFLDVTLDLNTEEFKPYSKSTTTPSQVIWWRNSEDWDEKFWRRIPQPRAALFSNSTWQRRG